MRVKKPFHLGRLTRTTLEIANLEAALKHLHSVTPQVYAEFSARFETPPQPNERLHILNRRAAFPHLRTGPQMRAFGALMRRALS
jgi:hypothetical protein